MRSHARRRRWIALVALVLVAAGVAGAGFWLAGGQEERAAPLEPSSAQYITLPDGVRLAAFVQLPEAATSPARERVPAILQLTRYPLEPSRFDELLRLSGFAVVNVDERGTAGSLGRWRMIWGFQEPDSGEIIRWITRQPWSNGKVGGYGISYPGGAAAFLPVHGGTPLEAVAPLFIGSDSYRDLIYPGGLYNEWFVRHYSALVRWLDSPYPASFAHLVGSAEASELARRAALEHRGNLDFRRMAPHSRFLDVPVGGGTWADASQLASQRAINAAAVPSYRVVGWFDAGFLRGALEAFLAGKGPGQLTIGPWNHGGGDPVDPLAPYPWRTAQFDAEFARVVAWLRRELGSSSKPGERRIRYYVLGQGGWRTTTTWPPAGTRTRRLCLAAGEKLVSGPRAEGVDRYRVWFGAVSGSKNRWQSPATGDLVSYPDRRVQDPRLLTYTSAPLPRATVIAGTPRLSLRFGSSTRDAAVFAYLEAVAPDGSISYLTEGELRASARATAGSDALGPVHPFTRSAARPLAAGPVRLRIGLLPIAVRVPAGYRLRIAIAGADAGTFARVPARGPATFTIHRGASSRSCLLLPLSAR